MEYLTEKDYLIAEQNGISRNRAYLRFYIEGWKKERAITQPIKKESRWGQYKDLCEKHGIPHSTFDYRIRQGMTPKEAATTPKIPKGCSFKKSTPRLTKDMIETAQKNGICKSTLDQRIYIYKWSVERAISEPVNKSKRKMSI